jgi:hypothetical protein
VAEHIYSTSHKHQYLSTTTSVLISEAILNVITANVQKITPDI